MPLKPSDFFFLFFFFFVSAAPSRTSPVSVAGFQAGASCLSCFCGSLLLLSSSRQPLFPPNRKRRRRKSALSSRARSCIPLHSPLYSSRRWSSAQSRSGAHVVLTETSFPLPRSTPYQTPPVFSAFTEGRFMSLESSL